MAENRESQNSQNSELEAEAKRRLTDARAQKAPFDLDMREAYFFAAPQRMRSVSSQSQPATAKPGDEATLNTSFGFELCGDFPTVIINTFFPQNRKWIVRRPGPLVPDEQKDTIQKQADASDEKVFQSINASNFYAECGKAFNPDLAIGTIGIWIKHPRASEPPIVQCVPIRELEINLGADGQVDDRFIVRHTRLDRVKTILPEVKDWPSKLAEQIKNNPRKKCQVVWGFWRLYGDDQETRWRHIVTVAGMLVHSAELKGDGSCPLVVARFNAMPEWAWGNGPLLQSLPELRQIDELAISKTTNVDMELRPPVSFPDGSFANIQDGIEAGMAYSIRPGEEGAVKRIYDATSIDAAIYLTQDQEQRVKRLFFLDWPQQDGKTPPTATQWLDEMTLAQQRIGTPGLTFWREFCAGVFLRFLYLLEKAGQVEKVEIDVGGTKKPIALLPYNPAVRASEQEDVALFARFAEISAGAFPEEWKYTTDGAKTIVNLANKMGVQTLWAQRDQQQTAQAIGNISKLLGGAAAGGPAIPGQAPPAGLAGPDAGQPSYAIQGKNL